MADGYEKIVLLDKGVAKELNSSEEEVRSYFSKRLLGKSMFEMEYKVTMEAIAESMNLMQEQIDELGKKIEEFKEK